MMLTALLICLAPVAIDGDSARCGTGTTRIRLFGIDTPERGEPGFTAAKDALQRTITGGLVCEPRGTSYSRIVAVCRNAAGVDVGKAQITAGHAREACSFSRGFYGTC